MMFDPVGDIEKRWAETMVRVDHCNHRIMASCGGEVCGVFQIGPGEIGPCGKPATHKVGEEGSNPTRHNLTQYICCGHFAPLMGPASPCGIP